MRAVAIFQFVGLSSCGTSQQLVAEADAHEGTHSPTLAVIFCFFISQERADMLHRLLTLLGVTRSVGEEEAVEVKLVEVVVPGHADDLHTTLEQATDDVGLHATINEQYLL